MPGEQERSRSDDVPGLIDCGLLPPGHLCPIATCDEANDTIVAVATIKMSGLDSLFSPIATFGKALPLVTDLLFECCVRAEKLCRTQAPYNRSLDDFIGVLGIPHASKGPQPSYRGRNGTRDIGSWSYMMSMP